MSVTRLLGAIYVVRGRDGEGTLVRLRRLDEGDSIYLTAQEEGAAGDNSWSESG